MDWSSIGGVLKDASQWIGWVTVIIGAIMAISKTMRGKVIGMIRSNSGSDVIDKDIKEIKAAINELRENDKNTNESNRALLRNAITRIYYDNAESKSLSHYDKENLLMLYEAYKTLKGNSYVETIVEDEMKFWSVK